MMMLRPTLVLLMVVLMLIPEEGEGWLFGRRRRRRRYHVRRTDITNNCHCNKIHADIIKLLKDVLKSQRRLGRREVSTILDVDEDDPLLEEFMQNSMDKRDGLINKEQLLAAAERAAQQPSRRNSNHCQCGRMVLEEAAPNSS
ncbi:uncharacterized protein LOC124145386 [Haliotis rufescens]|uniref:uncharacterized protein LOC124145386 n=1 Tax=Haliotis rufescens TaxID=6454 RepID=UPI00201EF7F5|nr:uncharacterized protein LOC124145386 [Haliotis rufescens]